MDKQLTKTFIMILNRKKHFGIHGLCKKYFIALRVKLLLYNATYGTYLSVRVDDVGQTEYR